MEIDLKKLNVFSIPLCLFALLLFASCKDGGSTSPSQAPSSSPDPAPTPAAPQARTNAELQLGGSWACTDSFCDTAQFDLVLKNTGGVGANLNFIRIENRSGQPILELGADHFVNAFGNNRIEAGQTLEFVLNGPLGFMLVIGSRDDNGVKIETRWPIPDLPR